MPELPEVETLRQHLDHIAKGFRIRKVLVKKKRIVRPDPITSFKQSLIGQSIHHIDRRGKFLLVHLGNGSSFQKVIIHLGMSGRLFFKLRTDSIKDISHLAVALEGEEKVLCYSDVRGFGRWSCDTSSIDRMGPEPLDEDAFHADYLQRICHTRSVKIKDLLMNQEVVAGLGNIYVNEILYASRLHPLQPAKSIPKRSLTTLCKSIRRTLSEAIKIGTRSTLDWEGAGHGDGFFYFGRSGKGDMEMRERFNVYDRENQPCRKCRTQIERIVVSQRGTYFCPRCQVI